MSTSTACRSYTPLDAYKRSKIEAYLEDGLSYAEIARRLGVHRSTIGREIKRNSKTDSGYDALYAQKLYHKRMIEKGAELRYEDSEALADLAKRMKEHHISPYDALHRQARERGCGLSMCVQTLYNYVKRGYGGLTLLNLPRGWYTKKERSMRCKAHDRHDTPESMSIDVRPDYINDRSEFGHWEGDCVLSTHGDKTAIFTLTERKTRYGFVIVMPDKTQGSVAAALDTIENHLGSFDDVVKTITFDNGTEFQNYELLQASERAPNKPRFQIFYAHPYRSGERGSNENFNGLVRRFIVPKKSRICDIKRSTLIDGIYEINHMTRKALGDRCAADLFASELAHIRQEF